MFTVVRADQAEFDVRQGLGETFAEGFTQWLGFFSKDSKKIAAAFAHMFILDQFYVAVSDRQVVGMAACTDGKSPSVKLDSKELRKHLGFYKGSMAGIFLKKEFEAPFVNPSPGVGSIEFVGTASRYRGRGVASQLIRCILEQTPYQVYLIEEGYPETQHGDCEYEAALKLLTGEKYNYSEAEALKQITRHLNGDSDRAQQEIRDTLLLLALDSDDDVGFCWWDAGELQFFIRKEDLLAGNFDRTYCSLYSS
ncbi:GNAT family N-acetyltransferase [Paenibacillus favisporus]|uniref:GNAT family N-acetyltransferase n=1 Tax=Paenibacillus favisporus TaxID=221028 RepID=UPI003D2A9BA8